MTAPALSASWWSVAACRDVEPEGFFPISEGSACDDDIARAKTICASCPVRAACLGYALSRRQEQGIWGGLTEGERRRLRRRVASRTPLSPRLPAAAMHNTDRRGR